MYNASCLVTCPASSSPLTQKGYYGSIGSMTCYPCPGGCSNCNIDYLINNNGTLQNISCGADFYCSQGIICTSCLQDYSLVGGTCVDQTTCRLYSYYIQGASSTTWSPSGCHCLDGYYFSGSITCSSCDLSCLTCNGPSSNNCVTCPEGFKISSGSCVNNLVYQTDHWYFAGATNSTVSGSTAISHNLNNFNWCGNYYTLFGYQSTFTTNHYFFYQSPSLSNLNYYGISVRVKILFIDHWDNTAGLLFRLGSPTAYPFATYMYNNYGAIGEM